MFTIRRVDQAGNWDTVLADSVSFDAQRNVLTAHRPGDVEYASGHVYVMNEAGKTVSVHNLEKQEQKNGRQSPPQDPLDRGVP